MKEDIQTVTRRNLFNSALTLIVLGKERILQWRFDDDWHIAGYPLFVQEFQHQLEALLKETYPEEFISSVVDENEEMQTS